MAWQFITQALAAVMGTGCGALLSSVLALEQLEAWGWRLPFVFAMVIIPVGLYIRKHIDETLVMRKTPGAGRQPVAAIIHTMPRQFVACTSMIIPGTMLTCTVTGFLPTYMQQVTAITPASIYTMAMIANIVNAVACYTGGVLYDRLTYRKYTIIALHSLSAVLAAVMFATTGWPGILFAALLACAWVMGVAAPMKTTLTVEAFPPVLRSTGTGVTYSFGVALFGGTAQMAATKLIEVSGGNPAAPLYYLVPMMVVGIASYLLFTQKGGT